MSVALSAGAGCGKTTVLTERFLGALEGVDRRPLHSLVAVTFTEKAARELRQRIRAACHERLAASNGETAGEWRAVLRGLEAAPVTTFHGYCSELLRRHAFLARIDPDFQVLDASLADTVRDDAVHRCVRRWLSESNEDFVALAVELGVASVRDAIGRLVSRRDADEIANWSERSPDEVLTHWERFAARQVAPTRRAHFVRAAAACGQEVASHELSFPKLSAFQSGLIEALRDVEALADNRDWVAGLRDLAKMPGGLRKTHWPSPEANDAVVKACSEFRKEVDAWLAFGEHDPVVSRFAADLGLRFARLATDARRAYDQAKQVRGGLDFDDLIVRARDLVRDHAEVVRSAVGQGLSFLLVDEFQDTDPVQAEILRHLAGEAAGDGRLFLVGDFKQSIYRFRGARPEIFQQFRGEFPESGRLDLSSNFRSTPGVIHFVNALFADAFPGETPRLIPGPNSGLDGAAPAVDFVWAVDPAEASTDGRSPRKSNAPESRRVEARWLARILRHRLDQGWPIRDRTTGAVRNAHAGDVAFLFRAMTDTATYEQALAAEGFDFHILGGSAFYAQQEVQDLINVLSVLEDPLDGVALAASLRGPFFGVSDDALFWLGAPGGFGGLTSHVYEPEPSVEAKLAADDRRKLARARSLLVRWSSHKDRLPIAGLVNLVLDESGYEAALLGEFLGDRKRANARKLVRLARRFDARGGFTLAQFVARLRADLHEPPREDQAATTDEEGTSVRLMSIHQSKGLEFPIVVVPDLNRKPDVPRSGVTFDPALGVLVRLDDQSRAQASEDPVESDAGQSLGWSCHLAHEKAEGDAEALRLFYVATTRARDALLLTAGCDAADRPLSPALRLLDRRYDRGTGECGVELPAGWEMPRVLVVTECPPETVGGAARARRPDLGEIADAITSTPRRAVRETPLLKPERPRTLDLDASALLPPRAARLDRLIRSALSDPSAFRTADFRDAVTRAARRQIPAAHDGLVEEAVALLSAGFSGPLREMVARAEETEVEAAWTWSWPPEARNATLIRGHADFLVRGPRGSWSVINVDAVGAPEPAERLRWVLSAREAMRSGHTPFAGGWRVVPGQGARAESAWDDATVAKCVRDVIEARNG